MLLQVNSLLNDLLCFKLGSVFTFIHLELFYLTMSAFNIFKYSDELPLVTKYAEDIIRKAHSSVGSGLKI